ncbi:MAG: hypothetical protein AB8G95_23915 [Anaerolineae bacterium]
MQNQKFLFKAVFSAAAISFCALLIGILTILPTTISAAPQDFGDEIPEIMCTGDLKATVFAEGLSSPDGLAFDPNGLLHVAEETAGGVSDGKISQVSAAGVVTPIMTGLVRPEGIAFDTNGNLYYVDDNIDNGALIKRSPGGVTTTLPITLTSPEGVAVSADDSIIYVTASDAEKAVEDNPGPGDVLNYKTYLYAISSVAPYTTTTLLEVAPDLTIVFPIVTVEQPSFSGITIGSDGKIYIASESSGAEGSRSVPPFTVNVTSTRSIFVVDPLSPPVPNTTAPAPFIEHLSIPEGLRFQGSTFPLLIVEEGAVGADEGRLLSADAAGNTTVLCDGFKALEDVIVGSDGAIYVTEDSTGRIIKLAEPDPATETPTATATMTEVPTEIPTETPTGVPTEVPTETSTPDPSPSATMTGTPIATETPTAVPSTTPSVTATPSPADPMILLPLIMVNR